MPNSIDAISGFHYFPYIEARTGEQPQAPENASLTGDVKSKPLGPKECKT